MPDRHGKRTDIVYHVHAHKVEGEKIKYIASKNEPEKEWLDANSNRFIKLPRLFRERLMECMNPWLRPSLRFRKFRKPSTGIMAVSHIMLHEPKELYIKGFTFYLDGYFKQYAPPKACLAALQLEQLGTRKPTHDHFSHWKFIKELSLVDPRIKVDPTLKKILKMNDAECVAMMTYGDSTLLQDIPELRK